MSKSITKHPSLSAMTATAAIVLFVAGCGPESSEQPGRSAQGALAAGGGPDEAGHDHGQAPEGGHPTEGPRGGHLIELGNEDYHAELLHD